MKILRLIFTGLVVAIMSVPTANARDSFSIGINIGGGHGYHASPIVRYHYAPAVRYYYAPRAHYSRQYNRGHHHYKRHNYYNSHPGKYKSHRRQHVDRGQWRGHYRGHSKHQGDVSRHGNRGQSRHSNRAQSSHRWQR